MRFLIISTVLWLHSVQAYDYQEYEIAPVGSVMEQHYFKAIDFKGDGENELVFVEEGRDVIYGYSLATNKPVEKKVIQTLDNCYVFALSVSDVNQDVRDNLTILCYHFNNDLFYIKELYYLHGLGFQLVDKGSFKYPLSTEQLLYLSFEFQDIDADGDLDVTILGSSVVAWVESDLGNFTVKAIDSAGLLSANGHAGKFFDIDNDGDLDVVVSLCVRLNFSCAPQQTQIYYFDELVNDYSETLWLSGSIYRSIGVADIDQDGLLEILVNSNDSHGDVEMIKFEQPQVDITDIGIDLPEEFSVLDINHDGHLDLVGLRYGLMHLGAGQLSYGSQSLNGEIKLINDFNGDELMDVVIEKNHPTVGEPYLFLLTQDSLIFENGFETLE